MVDAGTLMADAGKLMVGKAINIMGMAAAAGTVHTPIVEVAVETVEGVVMWIRGVEVICTGTSMGQTNITPTVTTMNVIFGIQTRGIQTRGIQTHGIRTRGTKVMEAGSQTDPTLQDLVDHLEDLLDDLEDLLDLEDSIDLGGHEDLGDRDILIGKNRKANEVREVGGRKESKGERQGRLS